ncbi:hypothetical protein SAMN05443665_1014103 [Actinomadura meyerae]|uniref:Uncharacterized protein n=1 Tax=Actinomadura meyerae TaxID=240840 RepID=A0A239JB12_9ACTN|nr:hypothetical protein [Actinomadura meyerae]SNT03005.1 hypothetical protein SAMN05443665_1014103 [Actinomadura meyerae]
MIAGFAIFWPAMMVWTYATGEKATATVTACEERASTKSSAGGRYCEGTWRTESGAEGEGSIYGLDTDTPDGTRVPLHIGPLGPYAGSLTDQYKTFTPAVLLALLGLLCSVRSIRRAASGRATARALLNAGPDGTTLIVARTKARTPGGGRYATLEPAEPIDDYAYPRAEARRLATAPLLMAPVWYLGAFLDPKGFAALRAASGETLLYVHYNAVRRLEPDYVLLDPSGKAHLVIRRTRWNPSAYRLLHADGTEIGRAGPAEGRGPGVLEVRDATGALAATAACRGRTWVLRAEPSATPLLRDASLVIAFLQHRLGD